MPALGSHLPMTEEERRRMFGDGIPQSAYLVHRWREDVVRVGEVPAQTVRAISGGLMPVSYTHLDVYKRQEYCLTHGEKK